MGGVLSSSSQVGVGIDMPHAGAEEQLGLTRHFAGRGRTKPEEIPKAAGGSDPERCGRSAKSQAQRLKREIRLLYLGRLHPIKGIETLLEACGIVGGQSPDWHLYIAGTGSPFYVDFLKSKVQDLGLSKRVEFVGEVFEEQKEALFAQSDVALVPSHIENFGIVVAESLAHAVPVIASKGTPWIGLETNRCGLWVDNDPESLATAIRKICTLPLQEMGQRGREWMEKDFSW